MKNTFITRKNSIALAVFVLVAFAFFLYSYPKKTQHQSYSAITESDAGKMLGAIDDLGVVKIPVFDFTKSDEGSSKLSETPNVSSPESAPDSAPNYVPKTWTPSTGYKYPIPQCGSKSATINSEYNAQVRAESEKLAQSIADITADAILYNYTQEMIENMTASATDRYDMVLGQLRAHYSSRMQQAGCSANDLKITN